MKVEKIGNFLIIDGEYYLPVKQEYGKDSQKLKFVKVDKKEFKLVKKLAKKLAKNINAEQILIDALAETPPKVLHSIDKTLFKKRVKPKVIQRHGCIDLKIGKEIVAIR